MSNTDYFDYMKDRDRRSLMSQPLGISNVGYMDDTTSVDPSNYLASLLGQGAAMFGAGIAGRDPGRVSEGINDMRVFEDRMRQAQAQQKQEALFRQQAQEEQRIKNEQLIKNQQEALQAKLKQESEEAQKQSELENPESNISKKQRMLYGNIWGIDIDKNISAYDMTQPQVLQGLKEMGERKRQEEAYAKQQKLLPRGGGGVRQPKEPKPEKEKKNPFQKEITEVDTRATMTIDALNDLEKLVKEHGNYNLTGPQNLIRDQLVNSIAADYNKVKDPNSTIRGEEAKQVAESLGLSPFNSKDTSIKSIQAFKELVKKQRNTSIGKYKNLPSSATFNSEDEFVIEEYRKNPDDPKIKETYFNMLRSKGM
jgi:hypothetical protein